MLADPYCVYNLLGLIVLHSMSSVTIDIDFSRIHLWHHSFSSVAHATSTIVSLSTVYKNSNANIKLWPVITLNIMHYG